MNESEHIEFKKSLSEQKEGLISLAAILNKHGQGELWFGVRNDGTPEGLQISEKTLRDLSQAIATHIEPRIYPQIVQETLAGKSCLKVVFWGGDRPYFAFGRAYMRVSDADCKLSVSELERLILEKNRTHRTWDTEASTLPLKGLYKDGIRVFLEKAGLAWSTAESALKNLSLLVDGQLLNAATVFFQLYPPYELRTATFASTTSATILDQHNTKGGLLELVEEAQNYILKNIHIGMKVQGLERVDVPEIHPEAIREAVINAFCHRDYRDPDPVQIAIYKDRIEIRNPGALIDGITLEDLRDGTVSRRRNPLIAELLRRINFVESWGRGIPLILEKEPSASFAVKGGWFVTTLLRTSKTSDVSGKTPDVSVETPDVSVETPDVSVETPDVSVEIIQAIQSDDRITIPQLAALAGVATRTIERRLKKLQESGRLRRVGPDKGGHWQVLDV